MWWLEPACGEELGSDLKCDRPGVMGVWGYFSWLGRYEGPP